MGYPQTEAKPGILSPNKVGNATKASAIPLGSSLRRQVLSILEEHKLPIRSWLCVVPPPVSMAVAGFLPGMLKSLAAVTQSTSCIEDDPKSRLLDDWLGCVHQKLYIAIGS